jgi:hypothetical protein
MGNMFDITPPAGTESPFNSNEPGDMGEGVDIAPIPVGVMRGHITEAKRTPKGTIVVNVQCDDPSYASSDEVAMWPSGDELKILAGALGIAIEQRGNQVFFRDSEGKTGLAAFVGKAGLFVFAPYAKDGIEKASIAKFGMPKPNSSMLWDSYVEQSNFSEAQIAAIKKASGTGVIPVTLHHLFT